MCGRFTLTTDSKQLAESFATFETPADLKPRYNIAPSQPIAVVANNGDNRIEFFQWGLVPSWAKDPKIGNRMINARAETLAEKPSFRTAFRRRRCLILADGFYEWRRNLDKTKTPIYIQLEPREPFAFAGLWESWHSSDGDQILSCTIITTQPNEFLAKIHNRMPVILSAEDYDQWIDPEEQQPDRIKGLLKSYPAELMAAYPVSTTVNSPRNDIPGCIEPLTQ